MKNIFNYLVYRQIKVCKKKKIYKCVPPNLIVKYSDIEDEYKKIRSKKNIFLFIKKDTCIIGFSKNGNFIISYSLYELELVIWRFNIYSKTKFYIKFPIFGQYEFVKNKELSEIFKNKSDFPKYGKETPSDYKEKYYLLKDDKIIFPEDQENLQIQLIESLDERIMIILSKSNQDSTSIITYTPNIITFSDFNIWGLLFQFKESKSFFHLKNYFFEYNDEYQNSILYIPTQTTIEAINISLSKNEAIKPFKSNMSDGNSNEIKIKNVIYSFDKERTKQVFLYINDCFHFSIEKFLIKQKYIFNIKDFIFQIILVTNELTKIEKRS
jgi:hypothetical protein